MNTLKFKAGRKTFTAKSMESIWTQFNAYAKGRGYKFRLLGNQYLGHLAWGNEKGQILQLEKAS